MNACDWLAQIKSTYQWAELNLDLRPNCSLKNYKSLILCLSHFVIVSLFSAFLSFPIPFFLLMMFPFLLSLFLLFSFSFHPPFGHTLSLSSWYFPLFLLLLDLFSIFFQSLFFYKSLSVINSTPSWSQLSAEWNQGFNLGSSSVQTTSKQWYGVKYVKIVWLKVELVFFWHCDI